MNQFSDQPEQPVQRKSSGLKTVLIVLGLLGGVAMLVCCGGGVFLASKLRNSFSTDPATIRQTASSIAQIEPPTSYPPMFSMQMMGMKMVLFGEEGSQHALVLMQFPAGMKDEQQMRQQMNQQLQQQQGNNNMSQVSSETRTYTIRGEECTVVVAKMQNGEGHAVYQVTGVFTAKDGSPAMLMIMMPEEEWTNGGEAEMEKMLTSMR